MILLTGSSGFVGRQILKALKGKKVSVLGRKKPSLDSNIFFYKYSLDENTNLERVMKNTTCIIHCAARVHIMNDISLDPLEEYREFNTKATMNLARQAVKAGVKRFIFISTIKVNGEFSHPGEPFRHDSIRDPQDFYAKSKSEAETQLLNLAKETDLEVVIIRPTLVYGTGVKANFASLMNLVSKGFPLPFGLINSNKRSLVSVTNLVDLIVTCIEHPKAKNQVFLVSDDHDVSTSEMVKQMSVACGKKNFQLPVPVWCYNFAGKLLKKEDVVDRLIGSLQVDISHTKETLDWTPPQSLQDGFKKTADYILNKRGNK
ncbi:SDR family oxidoreductase [Vibrio sp. Evd11]|uniref:UDP-glucose 4-epimerase family protein n=1 Tax=Vibrio sp. Evd11 TaxID=1207404 RepID=UPI000EFC3912|nr:SDR family oxidoreductase [Vibrio sp. Evd11]